MNESFLLSDTFDNFSFSDSAKFNCRNGLIQKSSANTTTNKSCKENCITFLDNITNGNADALQSSLLLDDSLFLSESIALSTSYRDKPNETDSQDIFSRSESVSDAHFEEGENNECHSERIHKSHVDLQETAELKCIGQTEGEHINKCKLSEWGLPDVILQKYEGRNIKTMFEWQSECLSSHAVLEQCKNLVYSAPTSAGKTLVAEILAIKTILERKKKVLFILPFVSLVREKMFYFQDVLAPSGVRVEGFMGSYNPPGGFHAVQLAICTIEKANSLVNRLLEEKALVELGAVIVDEMHLLGDSSRGYLLELLLTKIRYMSLKDESVQIQIIGMSATLPNLRLLAKWLDAELYTTKFRPIPLCEQCHVNGEIYDSKLQFQRKLQALSDVERDTDNILQLCLETIQNSCSVLIFCPTKNWCESLAQQIAAAFWKIGNSKSPTGELLREQLNSELIAELLAQLKRCPVGLDEVLGKTASFGVAFHHAGLTMDERDIIEGAFRSSVLRVLVATSTLSSGVNLPARRVIIRSPMFYGKPLNVLTYKQMIGRAGRMGKDVAGESILICQSGDCRIVKEFMTANLEPIESCLEGAGKLKRAILEVIASGVATSPDDVKLFTNCTLLAVGSDDDFLTDPISEALKFLQGNEFVRLQVLEDGSSKYVPTSLAKACLSSSLPPEEAISLFAELEKARQCFVLETELHLIYLVTPYSVCNQWANIDWMFFLQMWEKLPASMKRVGELVGVRESYVVAATRGKVQADTGKLQVHKRFYTALALQELVNEVPLNDVAAKFNCSRGMLQSLQQSAATFAGMMTTFSKHLGWSSVEILISQFQDRLQFGISRDLLDLMRLPSLNSLRARTLYDNGIETLAHLATTEPCLIESLLHKAVPFESEKGREGETAYEAQRRNAIRTVWITGKRGLTEKEAAEMLVRDARQYLQFELGFTDAKWGSDHKEDDGKAVLGLSQGTVLQSFDCNEGIEVNRLQNGCKNDANTSLPNNIGGGEIVASNSNSLVSGHVDGSLNFTQNSLDSKELLLTNSECNRTPTKLNDETKRTDDIALVNWSDESLFLDSFESDSGKSFPANRQKSDDKVVNASFESVTFLENAFKSSFNIEDSPKSEEEHLSSDCIAASQNPADSVLCSTLKNKKTVHKSKKRCRTSDHFVKSSSTDEPLIIEQTPPKKQKLLKTSKIGKKLTTHATFAGTPEQKPALAKLEIVNVCADPKLFDCFSKEVQLKNEVSLSTACTRFVNDKPLIGQNVINNNTSISHKKNSSFVHDSRQVEGVGLSWGGNVAYYVCLHTPAVSKAKKLSLLRSLLAKKSRKIRMFDCKEQVKILKACCDVDFDCLVEDPKVGDWLLEPEGKEKNLHAMALKYCSEAVGFTHLVGSCKGVGSVGLDLHSTVNPKIRTCVEAVTTWHLISSVRQLLAEQNTMLTHVFNVEMNTVLLLSKMELVGIGVDLQRLRTFGEVLQEQMKAIEKKAHELAGRHFSFASSKEVAKVLGMYKYKRVSTSKQVLEQNENPIAALVLQWRKLNCTLSKVVYPLVRDAENGRIRGRCITHTATGRISMHEPNLQNIARDFETLNPITNGLVSISCRSAFACPESSILVSADYCQLELRLLAHLSQDSALCAVMKTEEDVFKSLAAKLNGIGESQVTHELRQQAKQICYGIVYGMGLKGLSEQLGCSEVEGSQFLKTFHQKYPAIKHYIKATVERCKKNGYVETIAGRRRYLPHINDKQLAVRSQAERQAVNTTIQGSAADIVKNAMMLVHNRLRENFKSSKNKPLLVLHLHDELMYEVPVKHLKAAANIVKTSMEESVKLSIPFPVKLKTGSSWGTLKDTLL